MGLQDFIVSTIDSISGGVIRVGGENPRTSGNSFKTFGPLSCRGSCMISKPAAFRD